VVSGDRSTCTADEDGCRSGVGHSDHSAECPQGFEKASHGSIHEGLVSDEFGADG
jgi:hypothetical protein